MQVSLAVGLFIGTNIDDIFVLLSFFSDKRFKTSEVALGQYSGIFILSIGSIILAYGAKQIPSNYIGLLGFIPLCLGLYKLWELISSGKDTGNQDDEFLPISTTQKTTNVLTVIGVTLANGGDNVGVYVPLFAKQSLSTLAIYLSVFAVMTAIWCAFAYYLIQHDKIGGVIKRLSHYFVPWVFIFLGGYILYESWT